jgi:SPP1 gp7 family putative phage head morphogenesis protein
MAAINVAQGMAMAEAVEYAKARGVVLPDIYYGYLVGVQKSQATTVAGLASLEQIKFVIDLVTKALKEGGTFKEFQDDVRENRLGIDLPPYRLDNIFRTNIQVAYSRGRWEQQKRAASTRPYLLYSSINDSRTRPAHAAMNGTILHRDDPWWANHYPPCGYRCRCSVISLSDTQAQKRGVSPFGPDVDPDEGWDFNPGETYKAPLDKVLADFGKDLVADKPRLNRVLSEAKARIQEQADINQADRTNSPKK